MSKTQKIIIFIVAFIAMAILSVVVAGVSEASPGVGKMLSVVGGIVMISVYFSLLRKKKNNNSSDNNDLTLKK